MQVHEYLAKSAWMYACAYVHSYVYVPVCSYLYVCMCVCMYVCKYAYMYICMYAGMYVTGFWKANQIVTLGLFRFVVPANGYTHTLHIHSAVTRLGYN